MHFLYCKDICELWLYKKRVILEKQLNLQLTYRTIAGNCTIIWGIYQAEFPNICWFQPVN